MAVTKHDQILEYIETLPVGEKISVRGIAKALSVSEGTAYRAIKEAENIGLVSTIQRVGTIRIEKKVKENIETLQQAVSIAEQELDYVTRDLMQEILEKEEEYWDWTTTQLDLVEKVGLENYIQSQI